MSRKCRSFSAPIVVAQWNSFITHRILCFFRNSGDWSNGLLHRLFACFKSLHGGEYGDIRFPDQRRNARVEVHLKCPKCSGMMFPDFLLDQSVILHCWKCVNCGRIDEWLICRNRLRLEPVFPNTRRSKYEYLKN